MKSLLFPSQDDSLDVGEPNPRSGTVRYLAPEALEQTLGKGNNSIEVNRLRDNHIVDTGYKICPDLFYLIVATVVGSLKYSWAISTLMPVSWCSNDIRTHLLLLVK